MIAARCLAGHIAASVVLLSGCSVPRPILYADPHVRPYLGSLAQRPSHPIARTLTWKYHYTVGSGKHQQAWLVADGTLMNPKAMAGVEVFAYQPSTSGVKTSEVYAMRARDASRQGQNAQAQLYTALSDVALQNEITSERTATAAGLANAIQNLGTSMLNAVIMNHGYGVAYQVKTSDPPFIGEGAPAGTVLELFLRAHRADGDDAKPATTTMRWETVATLKDANGKLWRSTASYMTYLVYGAKEAPPAFSQPKYLLMDVGTFLPAGTSPAEHVAEQTSVAHIVRAGGAVELGVSARRAIEGLYEQLEFAKTAKR